MAEATSHAAPPGNGHAIRKVFTCEIPVRWGDSDRQGHVNNTKFVEYMQEARVQFLNRGSVGPDGERHSVVVRRMDIEFLRPVTDDSGPLTVEVTALHIGNSSYTLRHVLKDVRGTTCGTADAVLVGFDVRRETSRQLTDRERAVLQEYLVPALAR